MSDSSGSKFIQAMEAVKSDDSQLLQRCLLATLVTTTPGWAEGPSSGSSALMSDTDVSQRRELLDIASERGHTGESLLV